MKKLIQLLSCLYLALVITATAQTVVITNFNDWANPSYAPWDGINNGWNVSNPGLLTNQGSLGSYQFGDGTNGTAVINANSFTNVSLTVDITALGGTTSAAGSKLELKMWDWASGNYNVLIQTFQFDIPANFAGGAVTFTGALAGDYSQLGLIELGTNNLAVTDNFSATFTDLSLVTIPEPSSYALLALGLGAILFVRRRTAKV